jgi:hypothetical protein
MRCICPLLAAAVLLPSTAATAQTRDRAPVALRSAPKLAQDAPGKESWSYINPAADFTRYRTVMIEPTTVYQGADAQFNGVDAADRVKFAQIITESLRTEFAKSYSAPARPQTDTLRVRVNLIGVEKTKGGVATATRVTPLGLGLSAAKSVLGKRGTFTGSALYAIEAFDGSSGTLLVAAVRRRTPDPLDIPATLSTTDTIKSIARDLAKSAHERLRAMTSGGH